MGQVVPARQLAFLTKPKIRHSGVLSTLVKDSRQFKQREKRLLKVVNCISAELSRQSGLKNHTHMHGFTFEDVNKYKFKTLKLASECCFCVSINAFKFRTAKATAFHENTSEKILLWSI